MSRSAAVVLVGLLLVAGGLSGCAVYGGAPPVIEASPPPPLPYAYAPYPYPPQYYPPPGVVVSPPLLGFRFDFGSRGGYGGRRGHFQGHHG